MFEISDGSVTSLAPASGKYASEDYKGILPIPNRRQKMPSSGLELRSAVCSNTPIDGRYTKSNVDINTKSTVDML